MIFVDSNVPMYLIGDDVERRRRTENVLDELTSASTRLVTDVEVLQEIIHRYRAIDRLVDIQPAFDALLGVVDDVYAVDLRDVQRAKEVVFERQPLSARDALHVAVMERNGIEEIFSFDRGFDAVPGIRRLA